MDWLCRFSQIIAALAVFCLSGCGGPEMMIASSIAQAALKTGIRYANENKTTADEAWHRDRFDYVVSQAATGDVDAQFALGLYFQAQEEAEAEHWICRAATSGDVRAQLQLGHWYNEDRLEEDMWPFIGLDPSNREAYLWYSFAAEGGDSLAQAMRDRVAPTLTEDQLAEAKRRASAQDAGGCRFFATAHGGVTPQKPADR